MGWIRTALMWIEIVSLISLVVAGFGNSFEHWRGWDMKFDHSFAVERDRVIDWKKAFSQRRAVIHFAFPLGTVICTTYALHLLYPLGRWLGIKMMPITEWQYCVAVMVFWFISLPIWRLMAFCQAIKHEQDLIKAGLARNRHFKHGAWTTLKAYYACGEKPRTAKGAVGFCGRLQWTNKFSFLWNWFRYGKCAEAIFVHGIFCLAWPMYSLCVLTSLTIDVWRMQAERPWWGYKSYSEDLTID